MPDLQVFTTFLAASCFFGLVIGIILLAYEDGIPMGRLRKIKCKLGFHAFKVGFRQKVNKYFCRDCKKARKYPILKAIDGGKKDLGSDFRF